MHFNLYSKDNSCGIKFARSPTTDPALPINSLQSMVDPTPSVRLLPSKALFATVAPPPIREEPAPLIAALANNADPPFSTFVLQVSLPYFLIQHLELPHLH
jgi:hypothetical protein